MNIGGVDLSAVELDEALVLPDVVPGRWLNSDGDIIAYNCAGTDDTTREEVAYNLEAEVRGKMAQAGADRYILHLTGDGSDKGKRHDIACVKEYQGNRKGKPKPKNLKFAREYIKTNMKCQVHYDQEADDGMTQFQMQFVDTKEEDLCVLDSADKDLRMVQGLHLCPETGKIVSVKGYGECWYDKEKSKVLGWGTSFFWHQLLMGDTADNIPGLPAFGSKLSFARWPTKDVLETERRIGERTMPSGKALTDKQYQTAKEKYAKLFNEFKQKPAGAVAAHEYLAGICNDTDAYHSVLGAYESYYGVEPFEFTDWRGNTFTRTAEQMLIEQAVLLWMREQKGAGDCIRFFSEVRSA